MILVISKVVKDGNSFFSHDWMKKYNNINRIFPEMLYMLLMKRLIIRFL